MSDEEAIKEFKDAVNMTAKEISDWLKTDESKAVGYKEDDGDESVGHKSGKKIIKILDKNRTITPTRI